MDGALQSAASERIGDLRVRLVVFAHSSRYPAKPIGYSFAAIRNLPA